MRLRQLSQSKFYQKIKKAATAAGKKGETTKEASLFRFFGTIEPIVKAAKHISDWVVAVLPQFTLHDSEHLWNVLSLMEELAGKNTIAKMSPLECGLAIVAAFTHDLGMALSAEEMETLSDPSEGEPPAEVSPKAAAWRAYFDNHPLATRIREARLIAAAQSRRLSEAEDKHLNGALGQIRADYVRESHAREEGPLAFNRIEDWLGKIQESLRLSFAYEGTELSEHLALLAMSHGQSIFWLSHRLTRKPTPLLSSEHLVYGHRIRGQEVNWAFLSWLLRLADIMDFDASRTPAVLFDHIGIRDPKSQVEWQKHLSISEEPRFGQGQDRRTLLYVSECCPHPRIEKAIRDMLGWINIELGNVRGELQRHIPQREMAMANLPSQAEVEIQHRKGGYLYQDLEFQLRREAILELLMGESLYKDRCLALRELVQNALDAVHLRDLRNQLWAKMKNAGTPTQLPEPYQPWEHEEEPSVHVIWGEEGGRLFIRVTDNGVGMTLGAVRKFLTQIGRSYYKSDAFRRERELMREHGLLCTTISQFGIGFLSVFMLADHVTIRTRPTGAKEEEFPDDHLPETEKEALRFPLRAEIDGPHGLIAIYPESGLTHTGSEVTLWLKKEVALVPPDREKTIQKLKTVLYDRGQEDEGKKAPLNPAFEIARHIIWPLYPVMLGGPVDPLRVDKAFHYRELIPFDPKPALQAATNWHFRTERWSEIQFQAFDWVDEGSAGTGSRIRIAFAFPGGNPHTAQPLERLNDFLHPYQKADIEPANILALTATGGNRSRIRLLVNGIAVPEADAVWNSLILQPGPGIQLWVDLRGSLAPRLTADRSRAIGFFAEKTGKMIERLQESWLKAVRGSGAAARRWIERAVSYPESGKTEDPSLDPHLAISRPLFRSQEFLQEIAASNSLYSVTPGFWTYGTYRDGEITRALNRALTLDRVRTSASALDRASARALDRASALDLNLVRNLALDRAHALDRALTLDLVHALASAHARARARHLDLDPDLDDSKRDCWAIAILLQLLNEGCWPRLSRAFAGMRPAGWEGSVGETSLTAPLILIPKPTRSLPKWIESYDLISPFTGIPMGRLRGGTRQWAEERGWRALCILPFLYGDVVARELKEGADTLKELLGVESLLLLLPGSAVCHRKFADLPREAWAAQCGSALWDFAQGIVVFADGIHTRESIRQEGRSLEEWSKDSKLPAWDPKVVFQNLEFPNLPPDQL